LAALRIEPGEAVAKVRFVRAADPSSNRTTRVKVAALVLTEDRNASRLVRREVELSADGKPVELRWNGEAFL
jgi:hypothetical protein